MSGLQEVAFALGLVAAVASPHLLPLRRVAPGTAAALWLISLWLRALVALGLAVFIFAFLPQTPLFDQVARWCLHNVAPILSDHLGLSGHPVAHGAMILPGLALTASLLWMLFGLARAALALRRQLRRRALPSGPQGATVLDDESVLVAVPKLGRGRILVSRGALGAMDDGELAASLAHERAHLVRRHRPALLVGSALAAVARPLPGTRAAHQGLVFSLERDADEFAVAATSDPLALASAITKALGAPVPHASAALATAGGVATRLEYLIDGAPAPSRRAERAVRLVGAVLATVALALCISVPAWALASPTQAAAADVAGHDCPH